MRGKIETATATLLMLSVFAYLAAIGLGLITVGA